LAHAGEGEQVSITEFQQMQKDMPKSGTPSWFELYVPEMTDTQREGLMEALEDRSISNRVIAKVVTNWGYPVTEHKVGHWRRKHVR